MRKTTLLLIFSMFVSSLWAQDQTGQISGIVTDAETGEPLFNAGVTIIGTYFGEITPFSGAYTFQNVPPGDYSIKVQLLGYGTKQINGVTLAAGEKKVLNIELSPSTEALQTVTVVGQKAQVDLETAGSEITIRKEDIDQMNVRDVQEVVAMQAGVTKTQDGLQIRGARVYETEYIVDGISAQDPLAGTGFGVNVSSSSIQSIDVITGGAGAEFGGGSSGVINTKIREAGEKFEISGRVQTDHLFDPNAATSFNTDIAEINIGFPIPGTNKKLTLFTSGTVNLTDEYFPNQANQLHSSLFTNNTDTWAPRQTNSWTNTIKLAWKVRPGTKITFTNQHSLNINQNTRTLQVVGFDAILTPGYQYNRSNNLDNATTYTHHSNLTAINLNQLLSKQWGLNVSLGRLFTNLRADANGRPFRTATVDQILDEDNIITYPVDVFNPGDPSGIYYVRPGNGLVNNGGISSTWHDHYAEEYTLRAKANWIPESEVHRVSMGLETVFNEYQWVDVTRPWVGAPIVINDTLTSPSISIGSSNDIWKVNPVRGGLFVEDKITYKGIIASIGLRMNFWAPGKFADDAVNNPNAPVIDQVREDYQNKTFGLFGMRWKARLLPRINVSFPVTANNVLYFNYGHSMRLPHPRFMYAGLDPVYQDRSFLSFLGNPDLDPEVNVSYEVGYKSSINKNLAITVAAYNNNRFDYIVSRSVIVEDQTGRPVTKTMYINQDYAKVVGVEVGAQYRIGKHFRTFGNVSYQVARGKSNSARESSLQIAQNGEVALTREQYLAWDRPWNVNLGIVFAPDSTWKPWNVNLSGFEAFFQFGYSSGYRYTPQKQVGVNDLGRPEYEILTDQYLQKSATPWITSDMKLSYTVFTNRAKGSGLTFSLEVRNLLDWKNAQIINPITGTAYQYGDDVPNTWRDPRPQYNGPLETGVDPRNPARYLAPRQVLYGIGFRF
ncbi:MAG: TonB-dependent receptor [Bacteroidetes bacterium]|nr:MAG: TonB-dependent receptor [Bacteroidota bacterium]